MKTHMSYKSYHVEMMQYCEEVLAQSARNYAFTSDKKWEQRYIEMEKRSEKLLQDALNKADSEDQKFFYKMVNSNQKLVHMELAAIDLVNESNAQQAIDLLDSKEYAKERIILASGLDIFVKEHYEKETSLSMISEPFKEIIALERRLAVMEKQLEEEKFTTVGRFAAKMAHDLRNPLSIIKISLENMKILYGVDKEKIKQIEKIERAIDRMTHQVDDVLDFVRGHPTEINRTLMSEIITESVGSMNIPKNIKLILPKNDIELLCDVRQFTTVMNNLILNGIQAIVGTGTVEITVKENNDTVIVQVIDSGKGIPEENIDRVFDPLFTTKQRGTGLGLASVKTIIELHDGLISVTSPPTIFTITLPKISD